MGQGDSQFSRIVGERARFGPTALAWVLGAGALVCVALVARVALRGMFSTDEFTYAHAAWSIAHGQEPFRDYFFHHFPFVLQLASLLFHFTSEPLAMAWTRWLVLPFWVGVVCFVCGTNLRRSLWAALLAPPCLASLRSWVLYGTQLRPDVPAITFYVACLWLLARRGPRARALSFFAGVCFVLACWSSQKVVIYGVGVPIFWLLSVVSWRADPARPRMFSHPGALVAGVLVACVPIALYLTWTMNWQPLFDWCWRWGLVHETRYPTRDPAMALQATVQRSYLVLVLGVAGGVFEALRLAKRERSALLADPDLLVLISAVTTTISYLMQNAPYGWSLVAPFTFCALLAARLLAAGIERVFAHTADPSWRSAAILGAGALAYAGVAHAVTPGSRAGQVALLRDIAGMTDPSDTIYDNTGMYVARPHASFFFFTDRAARIVLAERLTKEIPQALYDHGVTVAIADPREVELPEPLRRFIGERYLRVDDRIRLWGQRFGAPRGPRKGTFEAVRDDEYYVTPASVAAAGKLKVDGKVVRSPVLTLARGKHDLSWAGGGALPSFAIVWLPADGVRRPLSAPRTRAAAASAR